MESGKILIEDDVKKNKNEKSISIAHLERSTKVDSNSDMRKKVFLETQKPEDKIDSQFQLKREDLRLNKRSNLLISERDIKKFVGGDEIIDKKNPFRKNGDHAVKNELYIDEEDFKPKSRIKINDDDFISTEEVLKQSKFVPVYIKNPDRVLTYDKSLLRDLKNVKLQAKPVKSSNRRTPLPTPRKKVEVNAKESRFIKKNFSNISSEYPKIKVKVGTELDESLHDPNEVIINALKFDKIFRKMQSEQTENLDDLDLFEEQDHHDKSKDDIDASQEMNDLGNEEKSYTNIISSNEFREYLKEKGLRLSTTFPTRFKKSSESKNDIPKETKNISNNTATELKVNVPCDEMSRNEKTDKKKTVFERFSKIFTKNRNIPSSDKVMLRNSSFNEKSFVKSKSDIRRRSTTQAYDGSVVVNNEFMTSNVNQPKENHRMNPNKVYPEFKYDTIIRRSAPYSQPIHSTRVYSSTPTKQLSRESSNYYKQQPNGNVYKPTSRKSSFQHSDSSHFNDHLEVDPFLYAKIHEMKKQADEVLLKKTSNQQILPIKVPESHNNNESIENPCYGEVMYYNPNGNHFNVMMRRTESSSLSKKQIMEKIYEYYKKNTQTPEHDQTNLSSASKAEKNSHNIYSSFSHGNNSDASLFRRQLNADYDFPISRPETSHSKRTITNTLDRSSQRLSDKELGGIYDVVYESTPNNYELETNRNKDFYARPQSKVGTIRKVTSPSPVRNQIDFVDIVYNNIIYRPIATIKENEVSPICDTPKLKQYEHLPIRKQISTTKTDENCSIKNVRQSFVGEKF
ncbi:CLUMA_CG012701, isoform A [Clunio marinus]|uniref:CLUMA_CG012701, isoform A n=1 Tax=Clunio marinus TaxID=568069 RepID=A0A1J1IGD9_9DIPT|nr:CLUMA_CG012701, isoform A [Clunio marinus]